jgi:hypothetical protein
MAVTELQLSEGQKMIYGRRRIVSSFYQKDPDKYKNLQALDIRSVSLLDAVVCCHLDDTKIYIDRSEVIQNFWDHRTRTPSYFDYKVWGSAKTNSPWKGTPIGGLDYSPSHVNSALVQHLGRAPKLAVDKDGVQKLYFVDEVDQCCTCSSWAQLDKRKKDLSDEFEQFTNTLFQPICKHLKWHNSFLSLQSLRLQNEANSKEYNPRLCVYHFDYRRGLLLYRITHDGVKANGQWLPVAGWKERQVYDSAHLPTGACWNTFTSALRQVEPFKLIPYSQSVAAIMSTAGSR